MKQKLIITSSLFIIFLICLILFMPLRFIINYNDLNIFTARTVSGTIWSGKITELYYKKLLIGDVDTSLSLWPIIRGDLQLHIMRPLSITEPAIHASFGKDSIRNLSAELDISSLASPLPAQLLIFDGFSSEFNKGACSSAAGTVRVKLKSILDQPIDYLSGVANCNDGQLIFPLKSKTGSETLTIYIKSNGEYNGQLMLIGSYEEADDALLQQGFSRADGGYSMSITGKL